MSTPDPASVAPIHHGNILPVGHRLHEFEITGLIGEGGFGIVYLARDLQLERTVAIKEYMPASLATRNDNLQVSVRSERHRDTFALGMRSFVNEAKLLASFDHPALIKVYRFWEANGTAYMVMPYYQGPTLKSWLREQKTSPSEAWLKAMLSPLLDALEVIHADHCYHRDIAPDNILLLGPEKPLLLDFGAARRVIGDATQALTVILKPGYAPLEQYAEVPSMKQGPWTDVYALCAVLYAVITGKAPPPSVGRMMKDDLVPAVVAAAGRYSVPFLAAIDAGLTVRPEQRPQNMGELRALLFATSLPPGYRPPGQDGDAPPDDERTVMMSRADQQTAIQQAHTPQTAFPQTELATQLATQMATHMATQVLTRQGAGTEGAPLPPQGLAAMPGAAQGAGASATPPGIVAPPPSAALASAGGPRTTVIAAAGALALLAAGAGWMAWRSQQAASVPANSAAASAAAPSSASAVVVANPSSAAAPAVETTPAVAAPSLPPQREPFSLAVALESIVKGADPLLAVNTLADKSQLVIGKDKLQFQVKASAPGYLYVFLAGTDQSHLYLLFPNALDRNNRIEADRLVQLPRKGWLITAGGPPGVNHIVTMVSPVERDLSKLGLNTRDSIPEFDMAKAKALWDGHTGTGSPYVGTAKCDGSNEGAGTAPCNQRYGASLVHIEEVQR